MRFNEQLKYISGKHAAIASHCGSVTAIEAYATGFQRLCYATAISVQDYEIIASLLPLNLSPLSKLRIMQTGHPGPEPD